MCAQVHPLICCPCPFLLDKGSFPEDGRPHSQVLCPILMAETEAMEAFRKGAVYATTESFSSHPVQPAL